MKLLKLTKIVFITFENVNLSQNVELELLTFWKK